VTRTSETTWPHKNNVGARVKNGAGAVQVGAVSNACFLLFLYFILEFFLRFSQRIPGYGQIRPTLMFFVIIAGVLFINRDKIGDRLKDPTLRAFFVFLGYLAVSLPLVEWPGSVIRHHVGDFVLAVSFLFFTALIVDTNQRLKWFLIVFVGCQIFRVLEPLYLNITEGYWGGQTHLRYGEFAGRLAGAPADVINANELGFVIVTIIPFLHYLLWTKGWKYKLVYLALMPLLLYALILTMSRGAFLALLVVAFMIFKESRHKLALMGIGLLVAVLGWSVMSPVQQERYTSLIDQDGEFGASVDGRIDGMQKELMLGLRRPIVGHGLGTTPEAKTHAFGARQASHNLYAELLIEVGVIGAAIFLTFLWRVYRVLVRNKELFKGLDSAHNSFYSHLNTTMIAVFWMYAVYSINYWGLSQYYWYLFAGLAVAFGRLLKQQYDLEQGRGEESVLPATPRYPLAGRINRRYARV